MIGWAFLYAGVILGGISLPFAKLSHGFENMGYGIAAVLMYSTATICWVFAVKNIPLTSAYIIWIGLDATMVLLISYFMFSETFTVMKLMCVFLVLAGCIGLNILEIRKD